MEAISESDKLQEDVRKFVTHVVKGAFGLINGRVAVSDIVDMSNLNAKFIKDKERSPVEISGNTKISAELEGFLIIIIEKVNNFYV